MAGQPERAGLDPGGLAMLAAVSEDRADLDAAASAVPAGQVGRAASAGKEDRAAVDRADRADRLRMEEIQTIRTN